jgi:outer membrane protein OmpA-like peptidoglycan-associated protein
MRDKRHTLPGLAALALLLVVAGAAQASGQEAALTNAPQDSGGQTRTVGNGERVDKFRGIVVKREGDTFIMAPTMGGPQTTVLLTSSTEVKSHKKGIFRGSKQYEQTHILRGLRLEVDGVGNDQGQIVADKIRFDEQDLRTAQALKSTVDPVEADLRSQLAQQQSQQEKLAQQLEETSAVAQSARAEAAAAQGSANQAQAAAEKAQLTADYANNRINGLDDYEPIKTINVPFATGSSTLGPKGRAVIDEAAEWVKTQDRNGWFVAVVGYADSTGNSARNRALSERRAQSVIYYLVTKHKLPMQRLVQPFGAGENDPVADNATAEGRTQNRRVEIRLMRNKGISGTGQPSGQQ